MSWNGPAGDLGRLLVGHVRRFRARDLQDVATRALRERDGGRPWVVAAVNASLRLRSFLHHRLRLQPRRLRSRLAFRYSAHARYGGPYRTLSLLCPTRARVDN